MAALALAGITGMYLRQVRQMRVLGLVGYLVFAVGYLLMFATEVMAAAVLPDLADTAPGFVNDVVAAAAGGTPTATSATCQTLFNLTGAGYMLGGLIFGIALFRARVLARWAAVLLAVGTVATAALAVLPDVVQPADGRPRGRRPDRPRRLPVAQPARQPPDVRRDRPGRQPGPAAVSPMTTPQGAGQPTFQPTSPGGRSTSPGTGGPRSTPAGALT